MASNLASRRAAYAVLAGAALLHASFYPPIFGSAYSLPALALYAAPAVSGSILSAWRARASAGADRWGWAVLSAALAVTFVLDLIWGFITRADEEPGFPSWMDVPYLASYVLYILAIGLITSPLWRGKDRRWIFDAGAVLAVAAGLGWHFVLPETSGDYVEVAFGFAYLVLDLAFLGTVLTAVYRARMTLSNSLLLIAAVTMAGGDIAYYFSTLAFDSSWIVGSWLIALAAATPPGMVLNVPPLRIARSGAVPWVFVVFTAMITAFEMRHGDGEVLLIAGNIALALVVWRQILSLRHALQAQREETAFREAVLDTQSELGLAMVLLKDGEVVFANRAAERLSGRTAEELRAMSVLTNIAFERNRAEWQAWLDQPIPAETRIARPDGVLVEVELVARRMESPGDSRVLIVARDVSSRRQAAEALAHAQKLEGLGALAGGVAHDFNNLLSAVMGNVGLLKMGELDAEALETVESIDAAARRGADLTRSLLDFARPQPRAFQLEDLAACLLETASLARPALPVNVALEVDTGAGPAPVHANRGALVQAFFNLIINARDAVGERGAIRLALRTQGALATVEVSDNGVGMDEATSHRIFEPFFTTKAAGAGTGLGLAISQRTVREHGGSVSVNSTPGSGTTFTVTLPLSRAAT